MVCAVICVLNYCSVFSCSNGEETSPVLISGTADLFCIVTTLLCCKMLLYDASIYASLYSLRNCALLKCKICYSAKQHSILTHQDGVFLFHFEVFFYWWNVVQYWSNWPHSSAAAAAWTLPPPPYKKLIGPVILQSAWNVSNRSFSSWILKYRQSDSKV